jgi:hypothetical protein
VLALFGSVPSHLKDLKDLAFEFGSALDEVKAAQYRCQEVVEVMRNPARQLSNGVHFLGLNELILHEALFCNVPHCARYC